MSRKFCGVDLDKNCDEAMLHTESLAGRAAGEPGKGYSKRI